MVHVRGSGTRLHAGKLKKNSSAFNNSKFKNFHSFNRIQVLNVTSLIFFYMYLKLLDYY